MGKTMTAAQFLSGNKADGIITDLEASRKQKPDMSTHNSRIGSNRYLKQNWLVDTILQSTEVDNTSSENFHLPLGDDLIMNHQVIRETEETDLYITLIITLCVDRI